VCGDDFASFCAMGGVWMDLYDVKEWKTIVVRVGNAGFFFTGVFVLIAHSTHDK
jgi:hypothetical protein